jgi:hypothetical protein
MENINFRLSYGFIVGEGQCPSHQKWNIFGFPEGKYTELPAAIAILFQNRWEGQCPSPTV